MPHHTVLIHTAPSMHTASPLRYDPPRSEIDDLFDDLDSDASGRIDIRELGKILRRGAGDDIEIAAELQVGAMGEIELEAKNRISIREYAKDGVSARAGQAVTIESIKQALTEDMYRVMDLMRALDADEDGTVTKKEFHNVRHPPRSQPQLAHDEHACLPGLYSLI